MRADAADAYRFDNLPLNPIAPGTNVLIVGPLLSGARDLLLRLLAGDDDEGMVVIAADLDGRATIDNYEAVDGRFDPARMSVIDCSQQPGRQESDVVRTVTGPTDLTGIGIEFSSLYEQLHAREVRQVRSGVYSLSTLLTSAEDMRTVYRFLHTLTGRIRTADGLGVCAIDDSAQDSQVQSSVAQAFDVRIDVREGASGPELSVHGAADQPAGWQSFPTT